LELRYYRQEKPLDLNTSSLYFYIIAVAVLLSFLTNFGYSSLLEPFLFLKSNGPNLYPSFQNTYINSQEWWRLITPTFLHFSLTHLIFNCLWIYVLGEKIEKIDGKVTFITIILISSICSNSLQYFWSGSSLFGGLSGVIYGLLGFCMILEMESSYQRYELPPALYIFMIVWLGMGFIGILDLFGFGKVANYAHLGGLVSGMIFAMIYKYRIKIS